MEKSTSSVKQVAFGCLVAVLAIALQSSVAFADDFQVLDPQVLSGSLGTAPGYRLTGVISQISNGDSTSPDFGMNAGSLTYPVVTLPVVTATPGSGKVDLSWTAAVGSLGWNVSAYNVGQSTVPGGPYTYSSSLGSGLSSSRTGLTNGTTYYFVVRAEDAFEQSIVTSAEVSGTPVNATVPVIVSVGAAPSSASAIITWTTSEESSSQVEYGRAASYGSFTSVSETSPMVIQHTVPIVLLSNCTLYHYRVRSRNADGNEGVSGDYTFTTSDCGGGGGGTPSGGGGSGGSGGGGGGGGGEGVIVVPPEKPKVKPPAISAVFKRDLQRGMEGEDVVRLQKLLGIDPPIGYFGPLTQKAVRNFQKQYGLPQVGRAGPLTRAKLFEVFGAPPTAASAERQSLIDAIKAKIDALLKQVASFFGR